MSNKIKTQIKNLKLIRIGFTGLILVIFLFINIFLEEPDWQTTSG